MNSIVPKLLERQRKKELTIYPVLARACHWQAIDWLRPINVMPRNGPVWRHQVDPDTELTAIAEEIEKIIRKPRQALEVDGRVEQRPRQYSTTLITRSKLVTWSIFWIIVWIIVGAVGVMGTLSEPPETPWLLVWWFMGVCITTITWAIIWGMEGEVLEWNGERRISKAALVEETRMAAIIWGIGGVILSISCFIMFSMVHLPYDPTELFMGIFMLGPAGAVGGIFGWRIGRASEQIIGWVIRMVIKFRGLA